MKDNKQQTPEEGFIVDYTMVRQHVVTIGSLWRYNRELDHSPITRNLKVKSIDGHLVTFEAPMPFHTYDIAFFDGIIFKPE